MVLGFSCDQTQNNPLQRCWVYIRCCHLGLWQPSQLFKALVTVLYIACITCQVKWIDLISLGVCIGTVVSGQY